MAFFAAALLLTSLAKGQDHPMQVRPGEPKINELTRFHKPDVTAMPTSVRLNAFNKRMQMLKESPFQQVPWRSVGSEVQGGRVVDIAVTQTGPQKIYVAYATGGLWVSDSLGQSWTPLFDDQSTYGIGDMDMSDDGQTIWVGSGEANSQRTSYAGTGVFKSTDGGATWQNMGLPESHHIGKVLIDKKSPNTVYVASLGPLYSQGGERGLYRTTDGGKSWTCILKGDARTGCMDVEVDPRNSNIIYAAMWERDRRAWNFLESGPGSAVYKSVDGGKNWSKLPGLPSGTDMGRTSLAMAPSNPDVVYAFIDNQGPDMESDSYDEYRDSGVLTFNRFRRMTESALRKVEDKALISFLRSYMPEGTKVEDVVKKFIAGDMSLKELSELMLQRNPSLFDADMNDAEIWRTGDGGKTWKKTRPDMGNHGGYYWNEAVVHPTKPNEVYTLGLLCLKSTDSGGSWNAIATSNHVDHHALYIDPKNSNFMLNGNDGGIYASWDAGKSWTQWNNVSVGQYTTIGVDTKVPYNIYGGLQDNGTLRGPSTYRPGITDINSWKAIGGGDGSAIAVDPRNGGDIVYTASQFGAHSAQNQLTNQRWSVRARDVRGEDPLRYNWISPILISKHHPDIIYLGSQRVHRSFDQGKTYAAISGDLTKNLPNGDVPFSTLTTMDESPFRFGQLYVGADDGTVKYTPDSGLTWKDIATPAVNRWVTRIVASSHKDGRVYCTQNGYRQDDWTPYVWVSEDNGASWKSIAANLPFECVNTIREDDKDPDTLYVGTDMGVYMSGDRGASWITLGQGIPNTPVHDLVIQTQAEDIVVASHARSVWVISLKPIRQVTPKIEAEEFHSFKLDVPTGRATWGYERSQAFNDPEPRDRRVEAEFWTTKKGKGTLSLVSEDGKTVVESQVDVIHGLNYMGLSLLLKPGQPGLPPVFGDPNDPKTALNDPYASKRAQYVAAGEYKLLLKVGGASFSQDVEIK